MKFYLLLLNVVFATSTLALQWYHQYGNIYITADKNNCNNIYVCKQLKEYNLGPCQNVFGNCITKTYRLLDCVNQKGDAADVRIPGDSVNPFTQCLNSKNYFSDVKVKINDCRSSYKSGNSSLGFVKTSNQVESRKFNYFTANDVHDRILTGYGWCKYNNLSSRCGIVTGLNCRTGECCSYYNYCGKTNDHCKTGCQGYYGKCK